ncbi:hypothetical protein [Herbaspirillum huttiense]|uniref:hypothetical protein n=1 Tax=Herbaspirillum huttiense TaxID=863372 RepID=UPI0039AFFB19
MTASLTFFIAADIAAFIFLLRYLKPTLSLSSTALGMLLFFHGPAYWYYTRRWAFGEGVAVAAYNKAWPQGGGGSAPTTAQLEWSSNFYTNMTIAVRNPDIVSNMDIALGLTMLLFCLGVWLVDRLYKYGPAANGAAINRWSNAAYLPLKQGPSNRILAAAVLGTLFMLYFMVRDAQLEKIFTYFASNLGEFDKIAMRRSMGGSKSYFFNLMLGTLLPFTAFALWAEWRDKGGMKLAIATTVFIVLVITAKLATLSKAPAAVFVIQLIVIEILRRSLTISPRQVFAIVCGSTLLFSIMAFVANSDLGGARQAIIFLFYRILMIPNESLLEYFAAFPWRIPHTHGMDIRWLAGLLGLDTLQPSYFRVAELHRGAPGSSTTAMFMADGWAAFSWVGATTVSLAFGALLRWIDIQLVEKRGRSGLTIAAFGMGQYGIFIALSTAFQTALLTGGLGLIVPLLLLLEGVSPWHQRGSFRQTIPK